MVDQRTFVTFEANLLDDAEFAESGDISVPGGLKVCEVLIDAIRGESLWVSDPEQHESYGWQFTAKFRDTDVWMLLQKTELWLLIIECRSGKSGWFSRTQKLSADSTKLIHDALKRVPEFSNISWFTRREFEAGAQVGSPIP